MTNACMRVSTDTWQTQMLQSLMLFIRPLGTYTTISISLLCIQPNNYIKVEMQFRPFGILVELDISALNLEMSCLPFLRLVLFTVFIPTDLLLFTSFYLMV